MHSKMIRALMLLGEWEVTSINTSADVTVYLGLGSHKGRVVVDVEDQDVPWMVEGTPEAIKEALNLFLFGWVNSSGGSPAELDKAYALAETLQPPMVAGQTTVSPFRWIP